MEYKRPSISSLVDKKVREIHYNELSAKIIDGLDKLFCQMESASLRWIWELLQNAKDSRHP